MDDDACDKVPVIVFFQKGHCFLNCDHQMTMAKVRDAWLLQLGAGPSVAFFTANNRFIPDELTVAQALLKSANHRILELHAFPQTTFWLQVFGHEESLAPFEVATILPPAAVLQQMGAAVEIFTEDFRLLWGSDEVDLEQPFNSQDLPEGTQLTVDVRLTVNIRMDQLEGEKRKRLACFGSKTVGELLLELGFDEDIVLVATVPYRRVLSASLHLCHLVSNVIDLHAPLELIAEKKVLMNFEPLALPHLRQQFPVSLSSTPLDVCEMLSEQLDLSSEFRLTVCGEKLNEDVPLIAQHLDSEAVIELDFLQPCKITDRWVDFHMARYDGEVYLYSAESAGGLLLKDFANNQQLSSDGVDIPAFDTMSMLSVFGPESGSTRSVLIVERDVERKLPILSFNAVERRLGWAKNLLIDIVPMFQGLHPKEIMCYQSLLSAKKSLSQLRLTEDTLITPDPLKIFVSSQKKLGIHRFAHGSTHRDVLARIQQLKGGPSVGLKAYGHEISGEELDHKIDLELYLLTAASRFETRLTVRMGGKSFGCWFEAKQVSFTDIMVKVGKQAEVLPRHLFSHKLFCCGCGRKLSKEEEPYQAIPANCCRVRSLELSDRRVKGISIQTAIPRNQDVGTFYQVERKRAVVNAATEHKRVSTAHPSASLRVEVRIPDGKKDLSTVTVEGSTNCQALVEAASQKLPDINAGLTVMFCEEEIYERNGEKRRALKCFDEAKGVNDFVDVEDGSLVRGSWLRSTRRFLRPSSPLPSTAGLQPRIFFQTASELMAAAPQRELQRAPADALADPAIVALMFGLRSGAHIFWELRGGAFINAESASGEVLLRERIPGGEPKSHVIVLMRDGDRVPRASVPQNGFLFLLKRAGIELQVIKSCVRYTGLPHPTSDIELWEEVEYDNDFYKKFEAAARKRDRLYFGSL